MNSILPRLTILAVAAWPSLGQCAGTAPQPASGSGPAAAPAATSGAQQYCQNIAGLAADARFAWQTRQINDLQTQLKQRIADLDAKQAELKQVLAQRDDVLKRARDNLVAIYAKMRPDAAAEQLSALDDAVAAAVLSQLNPRQSSAILNEVTSDRAVRLVNQMAAPVPADGKKS